MVRLVVVNETRSFRFGDNSSDDKMEQDHCRERHNINIGKVNISPKSRQIFFYRNRNLNRPQIPWNVEFFHNVFLFQKFQFEGYQIKLDFIPIKLKKKQLSCTKDRLQRINVERLLYTWKFNWDWNSCTYSIKYLCTLSWSPYATAVHINKPIKFVWWKKFFIRRWEPLVLWLLSFPETVLRWSYLDSLIILKKLQLYTQTHKIQMDLGLLNLKKFI